MKVAFLAFTLLGVSLALDQPGTGQGSKADNHGSARAPVLVELFTSEGCSSCPPADALLAKLEEQQPVAGAEIIALEEHVDYWDQLGWVDPFSAVQWTERQRDYAAARHDRGIYTPQIVINGRAEFVGSHERQARRAIAEAASQVRTHIAIATVNSDARGNGQCRVSVGRLAGLTDGERAEVWLAITETGLHSAVRGGENSGVDVHHGAVVRSLRKLGTAGSAQEPSFSGDAPIKLERTWNRQNLRAVVFVQERHSHHILGSAAIRIEP